MTVLLLEANDARIAVDGAVTHDGFSLASTGDLAVLAGDAGAVISAITGVPRSASGAGAHLSATPDDGADALGEAFVVKGSLLVAGHSVETGAHRAVIGVAPLDPPLPPSWTAATYVAWSARLAGATKREARELANAALTRLRFASSRLISTLTLCDRRVLQLASAAVMGPQVIVAEAPLRGLQGEAASVVRCALDVCTTGCGAIVSVEGGDLSSASAEAVFARTASYVAVFASGALVIEGSAEDLLDSVTVYTLDVRSNVDAFRAELASRGIELRGVAPRFAASLPAGRGARDLLEAARTARAALVEMAPLIP